ncbi:histidine phosphatase family protein [Guptibacillus algicola]|uniref:histidine phosphatase family protein n=1 Tax=Guptibacillus algicola TaxID=225844 RepID=UPI001CD21DB7|nr:histidine phosphatase family protein [Alkalihalobacillus algicola]MCA0989121.1 phosphoglycerate mutase family protein [Alkalihalobacillus algicola]
MGKNLYLIRHCEAEGQAHDASLTAKGREQAVKLADSLQGISFDKLYCSPFTRALQSIEPLALKLDKQITIDDRLEERKLTEMHIDDWMTELEKTFEDFSYKLAGGESSAEAASRGVEAVMDVVRVTNENALVATHGNLFTLILNHFEQSHGFDTWKSLTNPDCYKLVFYNDTLVSIDHIMVRDD